MRSFLSTLISASEKAALIARACRKEKDLFKLLIEEKTGTEKNRKFLHDFKTLADVLIQETVRHDLGQQYPQLADNIKGEESNKFTNTLDETICVRVCETEKETSDLLFTVLDNDRVAADLLSKQVHSDTSKLSPEITQDLTTVPENLTVNMDDLGIWIDPIDSTNNYIKGCDDQSRTVVGDHVMTSHGLQVVTVLIGVFDRKTGKPIVGVINQPFAEHDSKTNTWRGQVYWGVSLADSKYVSSTLKSSSDTKSNKIVVSLSEAPTFCDLLKKNYELFPAMGAGYKFLCVARGWADHYVTQKGSTFKWDTCAGHAILCALGGGSLDLKSAFEGRELLYNAARAEAETPVEQWSNANGLLAFESQKELETLLNLLKAEGYSS